MVSVASSARGAARSRTRAPSGWVLGAGAVLVLGGVLRLAIGNGGIGDRSALVLAALLWLGAWLAAMLLSTPRTAFFVSVALMALIDVAALPPRDPPPYDDRQALYRTDQTVAESVAVPPGVGDAALSVLVEPVFAGAQPAFGLGGEVNGAAVNWSCAFARGMHHVSLPIPPEALGSKPMADVRLRLTGAPSRDGDYLLVYSSAERGVLMSIEPRASVAGAITCERA